MNKKYVIGVREVNVRYYSVIADDPEQAKTLVNNRAEGVVDLDRGEYSHELGRGTWSVEETPHE